MLKAGPVARHELNRTLCVRQFLAKFYSILVVPHVLYGTSSSCFRREKAARQLLTLDPKDPKRLFEGPALLRRMTRFGLLGEDEKELDFVLQLTTEKMLERRLQTKVTRFLDCSPSTGAVLLSGLGLASALEHEALSICAGVNSFL